MRFLAPGTRSNLQGSPRDYLDPSTLARAGGEKSTRDALWPSDMDPLAGTDLTLLFHVQLRTFFDGTSLTLLHVCSWLTKADMIIVAAITITWYDYFLTLNDEVCVLYHPYFVKPDLNHLIV